MKNPTEMGDLISPLDIDELDAMATSLKYLIFRQPYCIKHYWCKTRRKISDFIFPYEIYKLGAIAVSLKYLMFIQPSSL